MATFSLTDDQYTITPYAYYLGIDKKYYVPIYLIDIDATFNDVKGNAIALGSLSRGDGKNVLYKSDPRFQDTAWFTTYGKDYQVYNSFFGDYNDGIFSVETVKHIDNIGRLSYYQKVQIIPKKYTFNAASAEAVFSPSLADDGRYNGMYIASLLFLYVVHTSDNYYFVNSYDLARMGQTSTLSNFDTNVLPPIILASSKNKGSLPPNAWINFYIDPVTEDDKVAGKAVAYLLGLSSKLSTNPDDPYKHVGDDPDDPPDGDFDYNSDDVTIPDLPQTSVTDSGLVTLFAPNNEQLRALAKYLWSDAFSLDSFKKLFNNPMDCILGLSILPIHLPHGSAKEITVGNIISTVSCDVCSRQYVKLNCGTFTMSRNAFTGGYLDYSPYTKAYLYLPFIGSQQIDIDEFMNTTIGVEYHIDILTGSMFCYVTRNNKLLLTYSGNCAENVPLSANDFTSTISSMLSIATVGAGAVATIATAGAAAPALAGASEAALGARTASSLIGAGATGAGAVMNSKPSVQHSGSLGGGAGAMGCLYPYILFVAPRISLPGEQNKYTGFPSNKIVKIGSLSGFNVIEAVNLSVKGATDAEVSEIEAVLRNGVII